MRKRRPRGRKAVASLRARCKTAFHGAASQASRGEALGMEAAAAAAAAMPRALHSSFSVVTCCQTRKCPRSEQGLTAHNHTMKDECNPAGA